MNPLSRLAHWVLWLALLTGQALANPCALPGGVTDGMGGTGIDGGGMGGTGQRPADGDGSGMGGTGHAGDGSGMGGTGGRADGSGMGGTGVVGVITGFASICVNGLEVFYGADTPVTLDGEAASADGLAVGQVVSVWASGRDGRLHARHVAVNSALVGPVSWVAGDRRALVALGQLVRLPAGEVAGGPPKVGENVRVSGLRGPDGAVLATRVERVSDLARPSVSGAVDLVAGKLARVGGLLVRGLPDARVGDQVRVAGPLVDGVMHAERVQADPLLAPVRGVERLSLQGVAQGPADGGGLSLGYARIAAPSGMPRPSPGSVVRVEARVRPDGGLELSRVLDGREQDGGEPPRGARRERRSEDEQGRPEGAREEGGSRDSARHVESHGQREVGAARHGREDGRARREVERPERGERDGRVERAERVEKVEVEKVEIEKVEVEKVEVEKVEVEKVEIEKVEVEKVEVEKVEVEKVEVEKVEVEKVEVEKVEKAEKPEKPEREERRERD